MCPRRRRPEDIGISVLVERLSNSVQASEAAATFERLQLALDSSRAPGKIRIVGLHQDAVTILLRCGYKRSGAEDLSLSERTELEKNSEAQEARTLIDCVVLSLQESGATTAPPPPEAQAPPDCFQKDEPPEAIATNAVADSSQSPPPPSRKALEEEEEADRAMAAAVAIDMETARTANANPPAHANPPAQVEPVEPVTPPKPSSSANGNGSNSSGNGSTSSPGTASTRAPSSATPLSDRELAEQLARELAKEDEPKVLEFERFCVERVNVDPKAFAEINSYCASRGERYVDPQFPPTNKSLYLSEWEAANWECAGCHVHNRLPPVPPLPKSKEEAKRQEEDFKAQAVCTACGMGAPYVVQVRYFTRPTQWLRPGQKCEGCEFLYSQLPTNQDLVSHMCTHFLRDSLSQLTVGAPWKLIREEARPEDVCQGGLGNCWFAGALSVVAQIPKLIDRLFISKEYNPNGVYHMQLCHAGDWRQILLDDLFPTSQVFEGYMDNTTIYYSRGGNLCYLQGARRQLWVPLVEKGAAKLFGCYGSLKGGTFGEAMGLFTGFPTERVKLYVPKGIRKARAERREARNARRTEALLRGARLAEENSDDSDENDDLIWSRLLSCKDAGYLMGMGCTEEGCEKTKYHIVDEMGLQAPHAYGIMDLREAMVNGSIVRLVKIRNPWGERAPRTWKGDWGKDSPKWTNELKLQLGVINSSGVTMDDAMSIFWMSFKDVKEYFAAVEICRIHLGWQEVRRKVWLPSRTGAGEAVNLTVFKKTQLDIAIWQEKHTSREGALGARSTNVDVGIAVMRRKLGGSGVQPDFELIEYLQRECSDDVSAEMILEGGYVYRLIPLSYGLIQEASPRNAMIAVNSVEPVEVEVVPSRWRDIACATFEGVRKKGKRWSDWSHPGITYWLLHEAGGSSFIAENTSQTPAAIQVDASESLGCVASRGSLGVVTAVPARSRQVLLVLAFSPAAPYTRISILPQPVPLELAPPPVSQDADDVHVPMQLLSSDWRSTKPPPDQAVLSRAPAAASSSAASTAASPMRVSASSSSRAPANPPQRQPAPGPSLDPEDEDLSAALRLSLDLNGAPSSDVPSAQRNLPGARSGAASAEAPGRPAQGDERTQMQAKVKELFSLFRAQGVAPNEAASRAVEEAKRVCAVGEQPIAVR